MQTVTIKNTKSTAQRQVIFHYLAHRIDDNDGGFGVIKMALGKTGNLIEQPPTVCGSEIALPPPPQWENPSVLDRLPVLLDCLGLN